jgi:hypothetical protein
MKNNKDMIGKRGYASGLVGRGGNRDSTSIRRVDKA